MAPRAIPIGPSSNIASVSYDDETGEMVIQFQRKGLQYIYRQIPVNVAEGFARAESPGKYFRGNVLQQYPNEALGPAS